MEVLIMTRYLIKVTYLAGEHEGESFLLNKKKQVVKEQDVHIEEV